MLENVKVQDCMTHPAITISPKMSVRLAQQVMHDYNIRHLPVVDGYQVVGMLSSGDIRRASPSNATTLSVWEMRALWETITVKEVMSRFLVKVKADTPLLEAVRLMYDHRFNSLPVVDEDERLVGILTEIDIFFRLLQTADTDVTTPVAHDGECPVAALS